MSIDKINFGKMASFTENKESCEGNFTMVTINLLTSDLLLDSTTEADNLFFMHWNKKA